MSKKMLNSVEILIETVKDYPILYNKAGTIPGVVNNEEKNHAWMSIAKKLNEEPNKLKQKWRNLRDSYQKAVKNKRELEEIGQVNRYRPYRHEDRMSFLLPHILLEMRSRKKRSSKMYNSDESYRLKEDIKTEDDNDVYMLNTEAAEYLIEADDEQDDDENQEMLIFRDQDEMTEDINEEEEEQQTDLDQDDQQQQQQESESICYEEIENIQEFVSINERHRDERSNVKSKDEIDISAWLLSVKESMSKLTKLNRARAKREINNILSKYEIDQYENMEN